jgi:hypothetical protein
MGLLTHGKALNHVSPRHQLSGALNNTSVPADRIQEDALNYVTEIIHNAQKRDVLPTSP